MHTDYNTSQYFNYSSLLNQKYTITSLSQLKEEKFSLSQVNLNIDEYEDISQIYTRSVTEINIKGKKVLLNRPLKLTVEFSRKAVTVSNEDLNLHGIGDNFLEAFQEFCEQFYHFFVYYQNIPVNKLIGYGRRLKILFKEIVRNVSDMG